MMVWIQDNNAPTWWVHFLMVVTIVLPESLDIAIEGQGHAFVMLAIKE